MMKNPLDVLKKLALSLNNMGSVASVQKTLLEIHSALAEGGGGGDGEQVGQLEDDLLESGRRRLELEDLVKSGDKLRSELQLSNDEIRAELSKYIEGNKELIAEIESLKVQLKKYKTK